VALVSHGLQKGFAGSNAGIVDGGGARKAAGSGAMIVDVGCKENLLAAMQQKGLLCKRMMA